MFVELLFDLQKRTLLKRPFLIGDSGSEAGMTFVSEGKAFPSSNQSLLLHVAVILTPTASAASAQPCQRTSSLSRHSPCTLFLEAAEVLPSRYFFT